MSRLLLALTLAALLSACGEQTSAQPGAPVRTADPNGKGQTPAFPGQTRAPEAKSVAAYQVADYVTGVEKPWGLAFLPNGDLLISEKPGRLRLFQGGRLSAPIAGVPKVDTRGQGGLFGLAL